MIDHIGLSVADYQKSKAFYLAALAPLGYELFMEIPKAGPHAGFAAGGKPDFWITRGKPTTPQVHVAFGASAAIGGTVSVPVHLDVVVLDATLKVGGETVLQAGRLVL